VEDSLFPIYIRHAVVTYQCNLTVRMLTKTNSASTIHASVYHKARGVSLLLAPDHLTIALFVT